MSLASSELVAPPGASARRSRVIATCSRLTARAGVGSPHSSSDEPIGRDDVVGMDDQQRQQRALPATAEGDWTAADLDLERSQDSNAHTGHGSVLRRPYLDVDTDR